MSAEKLYETQSLFQGVPSNLIYFMRLLQNFPGGGELFNLRTGKKGNWGITVQVKFANRSL